MKLNFLNPLETFIKAVLTIIIEEALEELPELKQQGLNYLDSHKEEFIAYILEKIKCAIKDFIAKKINQAKEKVIKITENNN